MKFLPIAFALGTALCWGLYGPTIGNARSPEKLWSPFKPYVGIGLAYIVWAFVGGLVMMAVKKDSFDFFGEQKAAMTWGFAAGTLGALGALSLTSAMLSFSGPPKPQLVMPIVFGGAVTITAIASVIQHKAATTAPPMLWVGMVIVVVGIILVAYNTPHGSHKPAAESSKVESSTPAAVSTAEPGDSAS